MADDKNFEDDGSKRLWLGFALVAVLTLVLSVTVPKREVRKYPNRKVVHFWHMWTSDWETVVDNIVDRFNESQTEYEVIPLSIPSDSADTKFSIAVAGNDPPDCMAQWNDVIPQWAENGLLVPLDEEMSPSEWAHQKKSIFPAALRVGMYKNHLYGVTVGLNIWALYYRPEYMRQAGLDPDKLPKTLEGLSEWAAKMDTYDSQGRLTRLGMLPEGYRVFAPVFGGGFYDWISGHLTLDTPANMRALKWMVAMRSRIGFDKVTRFESSLQAPTGADWPLITGSYAMVIDGPWRIQDAEKYAPNMEYRTAPIPPPQGGLPNASFCNGNFMVIPSSAHDSAGAWAFIKFWSGLSNPDQAAEFYAWGGWLPLNRDVADSPRYQEYVRKHPQFKTFVDLLRSPNIQPIPPVPYQEFLYDRLLNVEQSAGSGSKTPRQAMDILVQDVKQELAHRKENGYADEQ